MRADSDMKMVMLIPAYVIESTASGIELRRSLENAEGEKKIRAFTM
jgi:hypothetical protein